MCGMTPPKFVFDSEQRRTTLLDHRRRPACRWWLECAYRLLCGRGSGRSLEDALGAAAASSTHLLGVLGRRHCSGAVPAVHLPGSGAGRNRSRRPLWYGEVAPYAGHRPEGR